MDAQEIRQGIALLPPTAQSKPLLDALLTLYESSQNNPSLAVMRQELDVLKTAKSQGHPLGLCYEATCDSCMAQGQDLVSQGRSIGREAVQSDIDTALTWGLGSQLQEKVALVVEKWIAAGRPQPGTEPALANSASDDIAVE